MKRYRIDAIHSPLSVNAYLGFADGVPPRQTYDTATGLWVPDYRVTAITIVPTVKCVNKDLMSQAVMPTGDITAMATNVQWHEVIGGASRQLPAVGETVTVGANTYPTYTINADGSLTVRKNSQPTSPITIVYDADILDARQTGVVHHVTATVLIRCRAQATLPRLNLDLPDHNFYNPIRDPAHSVVLHAGLTSGGNDVPTNQRAYKWEVYHEPDGATPGYWAEAGTDALDYFAQVQPGGDTLRVKLDEMDAGCLIRCSVDYDPDGNASAANVTDASPSKVVSFKRVMPFWDYEMMDQPTNIAQGTSHIHPVAVVYDKEGPIPNPGNHFSIRWMSAKNMLNSPQSLVEAARGERPSIPTDKVDARWGMCLGLDVEPLDPWRAWEDSNGDVLTDSNGDILLIR